MATLMMAMAGANTIKPAQAPAMSKTRWARVTRILYITKLPASRPGRLQPHAVGEVAQAAHPHEQCVRTRAARSVHRRNCIEQLRHPGAVVDAGTVERAAPQRILQAGVEPAVALNGGWRRHE